MSQELTIKQMYEAGYSFTNRHNKKYVVQELAFFSNGCVAYIYTIKGLGGVSSLDSFIENFIPIPPVEKKFVLVCNAYRDGAFSHLTFDKLEEAIDYTPYPTPNMCRLCVLEMHKAGSNWAYIKTHPIK